MDRRGFLSLLGAAGLSGVGADPYAAAQTGGAPAPEFYVWREYVLRNGTGPGRLAAFMRDAAIPALNRLGHKPIGIFEVVAGVPSPTVFMLTPHTTLETVGTMEERLAGDAPFMKSAAPYVEATAADPVYVRQEVSVLAAFRKMPRIEVPAATASGGPRLFELRTYESHNERGHRAKVQMFDQMGEIEIFKRVGLTPVFFGRTIAGPRMPNLTYMLVYDNMAAREKAWDAFRKDPEWAKLRTTPGFADAEIVSNITTVLLRPAAYSQV